MEHVCYFWMYIWKYLPPLILKVSFQMIKNLETSFCTGKVEIESIAYILKTLTTNGSSKMVAYLELCTTLYSYKM